MFIKMLSCNFLCNCRHYFSRNIFVFMCLKTINIKRYFLKLVYRYIKSVNYCSGCGLQGFEMNVCVNIVFLFEKIMSAPYPSLSLNYAIKTKMYFSVKRRFYGCVVYSGHKLRPVYTSSASL